MTSRIKPKAWIWAAIIVLLGLPLLYVLIILIWAYLTEFKPAAVIEVPNKPNVLPDTITKDTFQLLTWNIGYAGLGENMDFFYDGGSKTQTSKIEADSNFIFIQSLLSQFKQFDFFLLQEIDFKAARSFYVNQGELLNKAFPDFHYYQAINYNVSFVPVPFLKPMGKVVSGIATFSKYVPINSERYAFMADISFPNNLFMLKRCFLAQRFTLKNTKELVIINTHNSAYDEFSEMRKKELQQLINFAKNEYLKGNYVLIGGDWNQPPLQYDDKPFKDSYLKAKSHNILDSTDIPFGWKVFWDKRFPSNRNIDKPYKHGITPCTVIDYFVASPNIALNRVETIPLQFVHSDHHPVLLEIRLVCD